MIYFKEIFFRILYFLIFYILVLTIFFYYSDTFFTLIFLKLQHQNSIFEVSFTFTSPIELIDLYFNINFLFSIITTIPFLTFQILLFLNSGLKYKELIKFKSFFFNFLIFYYFMNINFFIYLLPFIWSFFEELSYNILLLSPINIEYEPVFKSYFNFLCFFYYILIFFFIFFFLKIKIFLNRNSIRIMIFSFFIFFVNLNILNLIILIISILFFFFIIKFVNLYKILNIYRIKFSY